MDEEYPVIGFGLEYAGELIYCESVMSDNGYQILFGGKWIASIVHNDDMEWMQSDGAILTQEIIEEIGFKIDSHYK